MQLWGPNPLFDESNATDTGAETQGICTYLNADRDCMVTESIVFPDGSTLEMQGAANQGDVQKLTIVGGSGQYLGATGTMSNSPSEDLTTWTKTFQIWL